MKKDGRMINPIYSSVLYLTGGDTTNTNSEEKRSTSIQGPTVIQDQHFDQELQCAVPENPTKSTFVFPLVNRYCLFDGRLGHGVLEIPATTEQDNKRVTLLINWWRSKPENIHRLADEESVVVENENDGAIHEAGSTVSVSVVVDKDIERVYPKVVEDIRPCVAASPVIGEHGDDEDDVVLVDDVVGISRNSDVTDTCDTLCCVVNHPGYLLFPIDVEGDGPRITIGAAFLPEEAFASDTSSSSSGSSSSSDDDEREKM